MSPQELEAIHAFADLAARFRLDAALRLRRARGFACVVEPGTIVEVENGDSWLRAIVDESGRAATVNDPANASCNGWSFGLRFDDSEAGHAWRRAR